MIDQQQYQVEKILAAKFSTKTNRVYYLVKWANWNLTSSTWQPEQYLNNSIQSIDQYKFSLANGANNFNWRQYKEFRQFWIQQDTQGKIPKKRGRKMKQQSKQKVQKVYKKNKKITKMHQFIKVNSSKEEESFEPSLSQQLNLSHQYRRKNSKTQKDLQKISRKSEPIKITRKQQTVHKFNQMIEKAKQKEQMQKIFPRIPKNHILLDQSQKFSKKDEQRFPKLPKNHILLDQSQKSPKKDEQNEQMCEQKQNKAQNQQKQEMIQKIPEQRSIQGKKQEKDIKKEAFSKKICELIDNNVQLINQVIKGMMKDGSQSKKKQQQQMIDESEQLNQQEMKMKQNQKELEGQQADDQFSPISEQKSIEVIETNKTKKVDMDKNLMISNRSQYKVLGIKRESQNVTNVTNVVQLKYKVLNTSTNDKYWQNKQFMLKNCAAELIEFYENNLDWKNKGGK